MTNTHSKVGKVTGRGDSNKTLNQRYLALKDFNLMIRMHQKDKGHLKDYHEIQVDENKIIKLTIDELRTYANDETFECYTYHLIKTAIDNINKNKVQLQQNELDLSDDDDELNKNPQADGTGNYMRGETCVGKLSLIANLLMNHDSKNELDYFDNLRNGFKWPKMSKLRMKILSEITLFCIKNGIDQNVRYSIITKECIEAMVKLLISEGINYIVPIMVFK